MDKILLSEMEFYSYHGVFPEETKLGQRFFVDLELSLCLKKAGRTDDLNETVNYAEIYEITKNIVEGKPYKLVEAVAEKICDDLLATFPLVQEVKIKLTKPNPPIHGYYRSVAVELIGERLVENIVYLSAGSNEGDREQFLWFAIMELDKDVNIQVLTISSVYETEPVDYLDQPSFLNLVIQIKTAYKPTDLLQITQAIEKKAKRNTVIRFGPRTLDLDILLYNQENIKLSHLQIPHPRMQERAFVIVPLMEIASSLILPDGQSIRYIFDHISGKEGVALWKNHINWEDGYEPLES